MYEDVHITRLSASAHTTSGHASLGVRLPRWCSPGSPPVLPLSGVGLTAPPIRPSPTALPSRNCHRPSQPQSSPSLPRRPSPSRASTTRASASCAPKPTRRPTKSHQERAPKPAYAGVWIEDCKPAHPCRTATVSLPTNQLPAWFPALCSRDESQMPSSAPHGPTHCRRGSHRTHPGGVPARKERGGRSDGEAPTVLV
jgi:hypothetical protein